MPSLSSFREDTPKTLSLRPLYSPHIAYLHSRCRYIFGEKRTETQLEKKSQEIDGIWPFPYVTFGRFLSRYLLCSIASLRNFVLPDSIQTSGCIISPLPLWVTRPFSLPLLSMGSQPPRHRVLSQKFSLEHPFWTRHLPSYALLPPPHLSYFWGIPQRSMLIMANYRLNAFN